MRELIVRGVEHVLLNPRHPSRRQVRFPLIRNRGPKVPLTNEYIDRHVEFP
jgi:hypothetical protein